jgi:serine/threonine-protein kinase HipA
MSINGKRDGFVSADMLGVAHQFGIKDAKDMVAQVGAAVAQWHDFAREADVPRNLAATIAKTHRLYLSR